MSPQMLWSAVWFVYKDHFISVRLTNSKNCISVACVAYEPMKMIDVPRSNNALCRRYSDNSKLSGKCKFRIMAFRFLEYFLGIIKRQKKQLASDLASCERIPFKKLRDFFWMS